MTKLKDTKVKVFPSSEAKKIQKFLITHARHMKFLG